MTKMHDALTSAQELVRHCVAHLEGNLDAEQLELYDMAFARAELDAAEALATYASNAEQDNAFHQRVFETYTAEVLLNLHTRLAARPQSYGLRHDELKVPDVGELLSRERLAELGRGFLERRDAEPSHGLDEAHLLMRSSFRQFADNVVAPLAERVHREDLLVPEEIIAPLREMGCFGLSVPERFGGLKPDGAEDSIGMVVVTQALSRASLGAAGSLITRPEIMARAILEGGTEEQKSRWLPGIATGQPLCAISVTEPNTGSDVAAVTLRARPTDGGWLLNGAKTWCTFAGKAQALLVLARTDADARPLHRGLSLFVVDKPEDLGHAFEHRQERGGKLTGRAIPTIGYRGMHSYDVAFDDWFVPADNLIGGEGGRGRGFYYTMRGFMGGRLQTAARACGLIEAASHAAMRYGLERQAFGKALADYPLTLVKYARMGMHLAACQHFTYAVARLMDAGAGAMEASLVKLLACRTAEWVTREAVQVHGGMGYAEETAVSRYFVDARVLSIFEGAEETLAIRVVGKDLVA